MKMEYEDVNGPPPRYWKVKNEVSGIDLDKDDLLVFDGEKPGTVTKFKKQSDLLTQPEVWAHDCDSSPDSPPDGFNYTILGTHKSGKRIRIDFKARDGKVRASHKGAVVESPPGGQVVLKSTWSADEGP